MQATNPTLPQPRDPFQTLFRQLFGEAMPDFFGGTSETGAPRADIAETETAYELAFELPGLEEKDIHVQVHDHVLTLTAERHDQREQKGKRWHRTEHRFGQFRRTIALPNDAASTGIEAVYRQGVLTVTVPKAPESQPKRIQVRGG
jgi:HSP20 family protein